MSKEAIMEMTWRSRGDNPGISLAELSPGDYYRTLLTARVGHLVALEQYALRVQWEDGRGPAQVHRELVVESWPRPTTARDSALR